MKRILTIITVWRLIAAAVIFMTGFAAGSLTIYDIATNGTTTRPLCPWPVVADRSEP